MRIPWLNVHIQTDAHRRMDLAEEFRKGDRAGAESERRIGNAAMKEMLHVVAAYREYYGDVPGSGKGAKRVR